MSQKALFERLGAPLKNTRWSWGAVRQSDGAVFLRVWQDETSKLAGALFVRVTAYDYFPAHDPDNLGWLERLEHLERVKEGAKTYLIMCRADDPNVHPRKVASFNERELFLGGDVREVYGDVWVQLYERVPVQDVVAGRGRN